jgi:C-terminal processing protease CtpA/Prc
MWNKNVNEIRFGDMILLPNRDCIPVAILLIAIACLFPFGTAEGKGVSIAIRDSLMDIEASETTLAVILQALSEKTGLSLDLGRPLTEAFSCDLKNVTLAEAVEYLMANYNHALTYRKTYDGRFLPDKLFVVGADVSQQSLSKIAVDKATMPKEHVERDIRLKRAWFRQQFEGADKLSGQLAATSFYDKSGIVNILVTDISEKSPLRAIGLRAGDVIQNINGKTVSSVREFLEHLSSLPADMNFVRIQRGNNAYPLFIYLE